MDEQENINFEFTNFTPDGLSYDRKENYKK